MNKKALFHLSVLLVLSFALGGCGDSAPKVTFSGTWNITKENGLMQETTHSQATVIVDGERFRIVTRFDDKEATAVYDGSHLSRKTNALSTADQIFPSETKTTMEVGPYRFWRQAASGTGTAGGSIAGRNSVLYQSQGNEPGSQITVQLWLDAETNVALKRILTVYSTSVDEVVSKTTEECQEIRFGPVDEAAFAKL